MSTLRLPVLVLLICLPVALLAFGVTPPWVDEGVIARPAAVPAGDVELAWLHTTTNAATWERFVAGVGLAASKRSDLTVDRSRAFPHRSHEVPEVLVSAADRPGRLRIRWYKTTNDVSVADWVKALAERTPAPVAVIGGGSSDRARDLAVAMAARTDWFGDRPLLFLTTATSDEVPVGAGGTDLKPLVGIYPHKTFRFCFSNEQMTEAVLGFVWSRRSLRPAGSEYWPMLTVGSGMTAPADPTLVFNLAWKDDPFSVDLSDRFKLGIRSAYAPRAHVTNLHLPYTIGGLTRPNSFEADAIRDIVDALNHHPPQRALLILPTVAPSARRVLQRVCEQVPDASRRIIAVNGDGFAVNVIYRDGSFAWPAESLPVPLVLFAHHNPVAWEETGLAAAHPNQTDDLLHFAEMMRIVGDGVFPADEPPAASADTLARRLGRRHPPFFGPDGNRFGGTGEYVILYRPRNDERDLPGFPAVLSVYTRSSGSDWTPVARLALPAGAAPVPARVIE